MPLLRLIAVIPCRDKLPRTTAFFSQLNIRKTTRQPPRPSCDLAFLILFTLSNNNLSYQERVLRSPSLNTQSQLAFGGADRDRTGDLKLAKLALSQLSYGPDLVPSLSVAQPPGAPKERKGGRPGQI